MFVKGSIHDFDNNFGLACEILAEFSQAIPNGGKSLRQYVEWSVKEALLWTVV